MKAFKFHSEAVKPLKIRTKLPILIFTSRKEIGQIGPTSQGP